MAPTAADALQKAAERARRLADRKIAADDEAAAMTAAAKGNDGGLPSPAASTGLAHPAVVVNGVPVLTTPEGRIRRRNTSALSLPSASKMSKPESAGYSDGASTSAASAGVASASKGVKAKKKSKKSKKYNKSKKRGGKAKQKIRSMPVKHPVAASRPEGGEVQPVNGEDYPEPPGPAEPKLRRTMAHLKTSPEVSPGNGGATGEQMHVAPLKPAAKKAAPKPKVALKEEHGGEDQPGTGTTSATHQNQVKRSQSDNLCRATSSVQQTPSACPSLQPDVNDLPPRPEGEDDPGASGDESEEPDEPEEGDEEEEQEAEPEQEEPKGDCEKKDPPKEPKPDAKDGSKDDGKTKKKRVKTEAQKAAHARYMRFSRSLSSKKTPPEVRKARQNAKYCHEKLQVLLDEWLSCGGRWTESTFYIRATERSTHSTRGARVWLTRDQIAEKYKSREIANMICDQKLSDPEAFRTQTKLHPDCDKEEMRLFLVWDSETISEQTDSVVESLFEAIDGGSSSESGDGGGKKRKKSSKKKSKKDSSSSSSSRDESSSESEEKKSKKKKKGSKGKKSKKARGGKGKKRKETKAQKQARLDKEKIQLEKAEQKEKEKAEKESLSKGKKALGVLNDKIVEASNREKSLLNMSPEIKAAIGGD
ncbi:Uncharacterized protein SCF082_LOCUS20718 [Durusdinium trenchii]|uniref:Uncharacterized protein n=1 Tax=Durusdinium trenchii TaxID=1381693 RepID=A0ABP0L4M3_9DINO